MDLFEARLLQARIKEAESRQEIAQVIEEVFVEPEVKEFGDSYTEEDVQKVVNQIVELEDERILEEVIKTIEPKKGKKKFEETKNV